MRVVSFTGTAVVGIVGGEFSSSAEQFDNDF